MSSELVHRITVQNIKIMEILKVYISWLYWVPCTKSLGDFINFHFNHYRVFSWVPLSTNHFDGCKLCEAVKGAVFSDNWLLKSSLITSGSKSTSDVVVETVGNITLIKYGEREASHEGPGKDIIKLAPLCANKQTDVLPVPTVHAQWKNYQGKLVSKWISGKWKTLVWPPHHIPRTLDELREVLHFEGVLSATELCQ